MVTKPQGSGPEQCQPGELARADATQTVVRAMRLLTAVGASSTGQSLAELADRSSLARATALRLLKTLHQEGMVQREGMRYVLGEAFAQLAGKVPDVARARTHDELREAAMPFLQGLFAQTGETVQLAVLVEPEVVCLEKLFGHRRVVSTTKVGRAFSPFNSALGMAALSVVDLDRVEGIAKEAGVDVENVYTRLMSIWGRGYSIGREAPDGSVTSLAVAVPTELGIAAAISVSAPTRLFPAERYASLLRPAATNISRALTVAPIRTAG